MSGVTLRGAVRLKTGVTEFGFSRDDEGNGVISWASVPAGMWSYDVFMDDGSEESPLLYGCFVSSGRVTPDLPGEQQALAMQAVVAALVGLSEPWQASQVWAHLMTATVYNEDDPYTPTGKRDEVALDVEAIHAETGGRRIFTVYDYPEFIITDPAAVDFFKYFTTPNQ